MFVASFNAFRTENRNILKLSGWGLEKSELPFEKLFCSRSLGSIFAALSCLGRSAGSFPEQRLVIEPSRSRVSCKTISRPNFNSLRCK